MTVESGHGCTHSGVPKPELHVHIEGTLELAFELTYELTAPNKVPLPYIAVAALRSAYVSTTCGRS